MTKWEIEGFTKVGSSHQSNGLPCQDNYKVRQTKNTHWTAICISDGAGSAIYSEKSSKFTVEKFSKSLIILGEKIDKIGYGSWINDYLAEEIIKLREGLRQNSKTSELTDFNCTLVALLIGEEVSITIHVGDGAIVSGIDINAEEEEYTLNSKLYISYPKNGQNLNETFFVTEPLWFKDIQIKHFGKIDWFLMGSDGGIELFCIEAAQLDGALVSDVISNLKTKTQSKKDFSEITNRAELKKRTSDDICCVIGFRPNAIQTEKYVHWDCHIQKEVFLESKNFKENNKKLRENRRKFLENKSKKKILGEIETVNEIEIKEKFSGSINPKERLLNSGHFHKLVNHLLNEFKSVSILLLTLIGFVFFLTISSIVYFASIRESSLNELNQIASSKFKNQEKVIKVFKQDIKSFYKELKVNRENNRTLVKSSQTKAIDIEELNLEIENLLRDIGVNELELANKGAFISQQKREIDTFKQDIKSFYKELKVNRENNRTLVKSSQTKAIDIEELNLEIENLLRDIGVNELELANKGAFISQQKREIDTLESKLVDIQDNERALLKKVKKIKSVVVKKDKYIERIKESNLSMSEDIVLLKDKLIKLENNNISGVNNE